MFKKKTMKKTYSTPSTKVTVIATGRGFLDFSGVGINRTTTVTSGLSRSQDSSWDDAWDDEE